jgi:hypothetical protein
MQGAPANSSRHTLETDGEKERKREEREDRTFMKTVMFSKRLNENNSRIM